MAANELEEILTWFIGYPRQDDVTGNFDDTIKKLESLIESEKVKARIEELERLRDKEQVFVGYGYDEVGVDSDHIGKRLAELKEGGTE